MTWRERIVSLLSAARDSLVSDDSSSGTKEAAAAECIAASPVSFVELSKRAPVEQKLSAFKTLLDRGVATVHLDPRVAGVRVPLQFSDRDVLQLNFSYRYHIADFLFDTERVVASLSFDGQLFQCVVPWSAVFALSDPDRRVYTFHEKGVAVIQSVDEKACSMPAKEETPELRRRNFRVIIGGKHPDYVDPDQPPEAA